MIKECIGTGKTIDEAIDNACIELGCDRESIEFEIIDLAKKSFFGLKRLPARVRVWLDDGQPEPKPEVKPADVQPPAKAAPAKAAPARAEETPRPAETAAPVKPAVERTAPVETSELPERVKPKAEIAQKYLSDVLSAMGVSDYQIQPRMRDQVLVLHITGADLGAVIGRRGETLDSLQYLTGLVANRGEGDYLRINLDSGNYREKRTKTLEDLAYRVAQSAVRTGRSTTLEPMNPYDRRIIHATVSRVEGAQSTSVGEEPNRRVVISSSNPRRSGGYDRPRSSGYRGQSSDRPRGRGGYGRGGSYDRPRRDDRPAAAAETSAPKKTTPLSDAADKPLYGKIDI